MWWKILSILLIVYTIIAGMLVPLKPGITELQPDSAQTGTSLGFKIGGYNSFYTRSAASDIRVWLAYDSLHALPGRITSILNDTSIAVQFDFPDDLPASNRGSSAMLNAIVDNPYDGVSLLPDAIELTRNPDTSIHSGQIWGAGLVQNLHVKTDFSFPYRNVIYESIRNTYFHVPMWFVLMFLFGASVIYSFMYLFRMQPKYDHRAMAFAETGLLFGFLGLFTGMLWAHFAWGAAWSNDIKQLTTAVALLIYVAYFILRRSFDEPEKGARLAAVYNIFAFATLIPLLYIVPRMFASLHPGATGNPAFGSQDLDNTMRAVFYPAILGWVMLGFWIAQLRYRHLMLEEQAYNR